MDKMEKDIIHLNSSKTFFDDELIVGVSEIYTNEVELNISSPLNKNFYLASNLEVGQYCIFNQIGSRAREHDPNCPLFRITVLEINHPENYETKYIKVLVMRDTTYLKKN